MLQTIPIDFGPEFEDTNVILTPLLPDQNRFKTAAEFRVTAQERAKNTSWDYVNAKAVSPYQAQQNKKRYDMLIRENRCIDALHRVATALEINDLIPLAYQLRHVDAIYFLYDTEEYKAEEFAPRKKGGRLLPAIRSEADYFNLRNWVFPPEQHAYHARSVQFVVWDIEASTHRDDYPTGPDAATRLIEIAELRKGQIILEPSANRGNIANAIRTAGYDDNLYVIEKDALFREYLSLQGHNVFPVKTFEEFGKIVPIDRIVMDPPTGMDHPDVAHLQHAYELLGPGGRVVSVLSDMLFNQKTDRAKKFRTWFAEVGGQLEVVPPTWFKGRPTMSKHTLIVHIDKPK